MRTPGAPGAPAVPPPPPPEPEEVWGQVPLPPAEFSVNPDAEGLTGLETRLWANPSNEIVLTLPPIRGYVVEAKARPVAYVWRLDTGEVVRTETPGTEHDPAVEHVYETKGDYTLVLEVVWGGSFTAGGSDPIDLGTADRQSSRPYHVTEVRSALVAG